MHNVIWFDAESRVVDTLDDVMVHHPYACAAIFRRFDTCVRTEREYWHEELPAFWVDVDAWCRPKTRTYLFAHNAAYDYMVMEGNRALMAMGWRVVSFFERGSVFLLELRHGDRRLTVLSTTNYFAGSLAEVGRAVGLAKIDIDVLNAPDDAIRPYMMNDARIIERATERFLAFVRDEDLGNVATTLAGQAMNAFRHRFMQHEIVIHDNPHAARLERAAYVGGRVECSFQGVLPPDAGPYYRVDVNSLFPDRMHECAVPIRLVAHRRHGDLLAVYRRARRGGLLVIARCSIVTQRNSYPTSVGGRSVYPVGSFDAVLCTDKLDDADERGELRAISELALYDGAVIFAPYVDYFYSRKVGTTDPTMRYFYKLFLNALYGKFGQLAHPLVRVGDAAPDELSCQTLYSSTTGAVRTMRTFGGGVFVEEHSDDPLENEAANSFVAIAAHITSAASSKLYGYMERAGLEHNYYNDTDCLIVDPVGYERLRDDIDPVALGKLKTEDVSRDVTLFQPKEYMFGGVTKRKGISRDAVHIAPRTWVTTMWPRMTGMIGAGCIDGYENRRVTKTLSLEYKKGHVQSGGRITPFVLDYGVLRLLE